MKFSKKDFEKNYNPKEVEELYDPKKGEIGGDTVITQNQITTDTPVIPADNTSDRKKGISKDTDKHIVQTRNQGADLTRSPYQMGIPYGNYVAEEENLEESAKDKMRKIVKELLQQKNDSMDLVKQGNFSDLNQNQINDIEELEDIHLTNLVNELINSLNQKSEEFKKKQIDVIGVALNHLVIKLGNKMDPKIKNIIKNSL